MAVDRTTDAISHFIGLFELKVDQVRLRDAYDEFDALRREERLDPIETLNVRIPTDFKLVSGDPPLSRSVPEAPALPPIPLVPIDFERAEVSATLSIHSSEPPALEQSGLPGTAFPVPEMVPPNWTPDAPIELPGSALTVTVQIAQLFDDDTFGHGVFRDSADHARDLADLAAKAAALHAPAGPGASPITNLEAALTLAEAMRLFAPDDAEAEIFTLHGTDMPGRIVNGEAVEAAPLWEDLLPPHHAEVAEDPAEADTRLEDWALPEGYDPDPDMPEGHSLVTGGNLLVNEAQIDMAWIDAPMIAVGGQWIDLDVISQVAALSNRDTGPTGLQDGRSSVYQVIEIEEEAQAAPWFSRSGDGPPAPPAILSVDILGGDLLVSNHVSQVIDLMDNDHFGMTITGANTAYILGDNTITNVTGIFEVGLGYDLILIGGDFVQIDTIHQSLVLLDDDVIDGAIPPLPVAAPPEDPADAPMAGAEDAPPATRETGSDEVQDMRLATGDAAAAEDEAGPWEQAPDNLLMNTAKLSSIGVDKAAELSQSLAEMVRDPESDLETLKEKLMSDPALAGLEYARVLKIDGSLIQQNVVEQTIRLSDRDDIRIDGSAPPDLDLVAGSNALLNAATIKAHGVDSMVMAKGEVYSDLLIHQARLIDEPDLPSEADPGLVSEALAFLMDDAQVAPNDKMADAFAASGDHSAADGYDVMHGVLS